MKLIKSHILMKIDMELVVILEFFKKPPDLLGGSWNICIFIRNKTF